MTNFIKTTILVEPLSMDLATPDMVSKGFDEKVVADAIRRASAFVVNYCGRRFAFTQYHFHVNLTLAARDGHIILGGNTPIRLPENPLSHIERVTVPNSRGSATILAQARDFISTQDGLLIRCLPDKERTPCDWFPPNEVQIVAWAGYVLPWWPEDKAVVAPMLPTEIATSVATIAQLWLERFPKGFVSNPDQADPIPDITAEVAEILDRYRI